MTVLNSTLLNPMEIILVGFIVSLAVSAGALTYSLVKAER